MDNNNNMTTQYSPILMSLRLAMGLIKTIDNHVDYNMTTQWTNIKGIVNGAVNGIVNWAVKGQLSMVQSKVSCQRCSQRSVVNGAVKGQLSMVQSKAS